MSKLELTRSIFQACISKYTADRDDALSKINRALNCDNPSFDVESVVTENLEKLAKSKLNIMMAQEELEILFGFQNQKEQIIKNDDNNS